MDSLFYNSLTQKIIGAAIEVHRELGPGLLESVYEYCLEKEERKRGLDVQRQVQLPVFYKGDRLNKEFYIDLLVENTIVLELKCVDLILPIHEVQLLTYLRLSHKKVGLLLNFNVPYLKDGIRRKINGYL